MLYFRRLSLRPNSSLGVVCLGEGGCQSESGFNEGKLHNTALCVIFKHISYFCLLFPRDFLMIMLIFSLTFPLHCAFSSLEKLKGAQAQRRPQHTALVRRAAGHRRRPVLRRDGLFHSKLVASSYRNMLSQNPSTWTLL